MSTADLSRNRTRLFARVLGPYLIVLAVAAVVHAQQMSTLLAEFGDSTAWWWVTGAFVLLSGLVVIALHSNWHGTPAIVVSVIGWMITLKGAFLVALPELSMSAAEFMLDRNGWWQALMVFVVLVGLYLTFIGWAPKVSLRNTIREVPSPQHSHHAL